MIPHHHIYNLKYIHCVWSWQVPSSPAGISVLWDDTLELIDATFISSTDIRRQFPSQNRSAYRQSNRKDTIMRTKQLSQMYSPVTVALGQYRQAVSSSYPSHNYPAMDLEVLNTSERGLIRSKKSAESRNLIPSALVPFGMVMSHIGKREQQISVHLFQRWNI